MAEQLLPDRIAAQLAEFDRRLRNLETSPRVGLNGARFVRQFGSGDATTFTNWETGPAASNWVDDQGNTGAGYGQLTMANMGKRAAIFFGATISGVYVNATVRSANALFGIGYAGLNPAQNPAYPIMYRRFYPGSASYTETPFNFFVCRNDFTPGATNVFKIWAAWENTNPAAGLQPQLIDGFMLVIPLDL